MSIRIVDGEEPYAILEQNCVAEDADALLDWLRFTVDPLVDLGSCSHLHTAVLQLLMAARVRTRALPPDPVLADCLLACGIKNDPHTAKESPPAPVRAADELPLQPPTHMVAFAAPGHTELRAVIEVPS